MAIALIAASLAFGGSEPGPTILVVGDSLTEGTLPHLRRELKWAAVLGDAERSRRSLPAARIVGGKWRSRFDAVVFDVGTNDLNADELAGSLNSVRGIVGTSTPLFVATLNTPFRERRKNRMLHRFARSRRTVHLIDWKARSEGLLAPDGVHASAAGYEVRAKLFANEIREVLR